MKLHFNKFIHSYAQRRYRLLFYSLLLTFSAAPLLAASQLPSNLLQIFLGINFAAALFAERHLRSSQLIGLFFLLLICGKLLAYVLNLNFISHAVIPLLGVLAIGTVAVMVKTSLNSDRVNSETLYAALSGYLIGGLCMAYIYWGIERALPDSFILADSIVNKTFSISMAIYFSFVTLATLGYGDIIPATELTRGLVIVQCVAGQLYLVVMIARLVSLYRKQAE